MSDGLTVYVIFQSPRDYPGKFVVRPQRVTRGGGIVHDPPIYVGKHIASARCRIPAGLIPMLRDPNDDPAILETWI